MAAGTRTGTGDAATLAGREILVVDDSRITREMIARRLGKLGYDVTTREDGLEALAVLEGRQFDLVLLDMVMPRLSGVRTLREMRASLRHADVPVMMMTARMDPAAAIEALEVRLCGAGGADQAAAAPRGDDRIAAQGQCIAGCARRGSRRRSRHAAQSARRRTG